MQTYKKKFAEFLVRADALQFGEFTLKSGRSSPYFFNSAKFNTGPLIEELGSYYAAAIEENTPNCNLIYGPAYKGIPLASATAMTLVRDHGHDVGFCFNRKEAKDHGEGGNLIGSPLSGRVLIIDDVISAGISICEAVDFICAAGAKPCGVIIALDRMEQGNNGLSAIQEIKEMYDIPVISIINFNCIF